MIWLQEPFGDQPRGVRVNKRAVVIDLDGTLLNSQRIVTARNEMAIRSAANSGWTVIFATARPLRSVKSVLPHDFSQFYWATCNGAWLIREGHILERYEIPGHRLYHLVNLLVSNNLPFQIEADDCMFTDCGVPEGFTGVYFPISHFNWRGACKVIVNISSAQQVSDVMGLLPSECTGIITDRDTLLQISDSRCNKLASAKYILDREQISLEETIAFGDDTNDFELIKAVGYGVAMDNATPELRQAARYVTATNDEDGVSVFLEKMLHAHIGD